MISLRKTIDDVDHFTTRFEALRQAHLALTEALPGAALPAAPELSEKVRENLERASLAVTYSASAKDLEKAGKLALAELQSICRSNSSAIEERDSVLKEATGSFADLLHGLRGHGDRHSRVLTEIADEFESLSQVEDVNELRRRLREDVIKLRVSVEAMRQENEESVERFESQISSFQERLEKARRESGLDRLTGLGGRREAEQALRLVARRPGPVCVLLFDIEGFGEINRRNGTMFGDKVVQALAHTLSESFPDKDSLFRWGADEFLVIEQGRLVVRLEGCRSICRRFAGDSHYSVDGGAKRVCANVASGGTEYRPGDSVDDLYRRARENMEMSRGK